MHINKQSRDIYLTPDGDFYKEEQGNVEIASSYKSRVLESAITTRLASSVGDWRDIPDFPGANLIDFMGLPNNPDVGALIQSRIVDTLTFDNLIKGYDLEVDVVPTGLREVLIILIVSSLEEEEAPLVFGFTYDIRDNKMIPRVINIG